MCAECVKFSTEPKILNVDKAKVKGMLKAYANFYEAASFEDMDTRLDFLQKLESCLRGENARMTLYEQQLHDSALLALEAASVSCRKSVESYYSNEESRVTHAISLLKCLRDLKELGQGFEIMDRISVAKQMEIIPPLHEVTTGRNPPVADMAEGKFSYKFPATAIQQTKLLALAASRMFQESTTGEDANEYKISRFTSIGNRWGVYDDKNQVEAVSFSVSKTIFLTGIGLGTCYNAGKTVTVHEISIIQGISSGGQKMAVIAGFVISNVDNSVRVAKLMFERPVEITELQDYTIRLVAKGDSGMYRGQTSQQLVTGPKGVEFTFKSTSYVPADIKNGDNLTDGPILEVFYQVTAAEQITIQRFSDFVPGRMCRQGAKDAITFQSNKNAKLNGVSVGAPTEAGPAMASVEVVESNRCPGKLIYAIPRAELLPYSAAQKLVKINFPTPLSVKAGIQYTIIVQLSCSAVHNGVSSLGQVITQGPLSIQFSDPLYEGTAEANGPNLMEGPIAALHFSDVIESDNLFGKRYAALGRVNPEMAERAGGELRIRRFQEVEKGWEVAKGRKETLTFQVDQPLLLIAFGLGGAMEIGETVNLNGICLMTGNSLDSKVIYASVDYQTLYTRPDCEPIHRVAFNPPVELSPHLAYTLLLTLQPGKFYQGVVAAPQVRVDSTTTCTFLQTGGIQGAAAHSGDSSGPIIDLYFTATECSLQQVKEQIYKVLSEKESQAREVLISRFSSLGSAWSINDDGKQVEAITFKTSSSVQLSAVGVAAAYAEGSTVRIKTLEIRKGQGTRGDILYQHSQQIILQRTSRADQFFKVALTRPVPLLPATDYTLRVQYEERAQVARGTEVNNKPSVEGLTVTFTRAQFEGGDTENGSHENHGPIRDFYFVLA